MNPPLPIAISRALALVLLLIAPCVASGGAPPPFLKLDEYTTLAHELSHKVNLFQETWKANPDAVFYGGTSRDFLYWLKGQFAGAKSRAEVDATIKRLKALPRIDVRDFIIGDSDIDVVSDRAIKLDPAHYGIKRIDTLSKDIFDPDSVAGKNEI